MKKPSAGVIIFGILFILFGLLCARGVLTYFAYRDVVPHMYRGMVTRTGELERLTDEKAAENPERAARARRELKDIRADIRRFHQRFIMRPGVPVSALLFIVCSALSAGVLVFTGYSLIRLRPDARKWIAFSFAAVFAWLVLLFVSAYLTTFPVSRLAARFHAFTKYLNGQSASLIPSGPGARGMWDFIPQIYLNIVYVSACIYLVALALTSIFFSREKIKTQFSSGCRKERQVEG
ncbi:MAG: hypothetical protein GF333_01090 [Candidatus Omnitrophica bacterium]|nr:hypothetical protein [Candidatus Omnitrophota bacterium]